MAKFCNISRNVRAAFDDVLGLAKGSVCLLAILVTKNSNNSKKVELGMLGRKSLLSVIGLLGFGLAAGVATAEFDFEDSRYEVYIGDLNGDGLDDVYFYINDSIIPIHGDVIVPIVLPFSDQSFVVYSYEGAVNYYTQPQIVGSLDLSQLAVYTGNITFEDINNDGIADIRLSEAGNMVRDLTLIGGEQLAIHYDDAGSGNLAGLPDPSFDFGAINPANDSLSGDIYYGALSGQHSVAPDGSFNYTLPLSLAPGVNGFAPNLTLNYNSNSRNGLVGWGWGIGGQAVISRCKATPARDGYSSGINHSDDFKFCLNGQRLVEVASGEYRTEGESFARITSIVNTDGDPKVPDYWIVERPNGSVQTYGKTVDSEFVDGAGKTMEWYLSSFEDVVGNAIDYTYHNDSLAGELYLTEVAWGAGKLSNSVALEYESRADVQSGYAAGARKAVSKRLKAIDVRANNASVRKYLLGYQVVGNSYDGADYEEPTSISRLHRVDLCADNAKTMCSEPLIFSWGSASVDDFILGAGEETLNYNLDYDTDLTHAELSYSSLDFGYFVNPSVFAPGYKQSIPKDNATQLSEDHVAGDPIDSSRGSRVYAYGDFDGDGLKEAAWSVCSNNTCDHYVRYGIGEPDILFATTDRAVQVELSNVVTRGYANQGAVSDLNGDGIDDYFIHSAEFMGGVESYLGSPNGFIHSQEYSISETNFYVNGSGRKWPYKSFFLDVNGDGLVDILQEPYGFPDDNATSSFDFNGNKISININTGLGFAGFQQLATLTGVTNLDLYPSDPYLPTYWFAQYTDFNGDRIKDRLLYSSDGSIEIALNSLNLLELSDQFSYPSHFLGPIQSEFVCGSDDARLPHPDQKLVSGDFNGDGLADILAITSNGLQVSLSTGSGLSVPSYWLDSESMAALVCQEQGDRLPLFKSGDLNLDGKSDLIALNRLIGSQACKATVYYALEDGFSDPTCVVGEDFKNENLVNAEYIQFLDYGLWPASTSVDISRSEEGYPTLEVSYFISGFNGEKYRSYVISKPRNLIAVSESGRRIDVDYDSINRNPSIYTQTPSDSLSNSALYASTNVTYISSGLDSNPYTTEVEESPAVNALGSIDGNSRTTPSSQLVVTELRVTDLGSLSTSTAFRYQDFVASANGYGAFGFKRVDQIQALGTGGHLRKITDYHHSVDTTYGYKFSARPKRVREYAKGDAVGDQEQLVSDIINQWEVRVYQDDIDVDSDTSAPFSPHLFSYLASSSKETWDLDGSYIGIEKSYTSNEATNCAPISLEAAEQVTNVLAGSSGDNHYHADGIVLYERIINCGGDVNVARATENTSISSIKTEDLWVLGLVGTTKQHAWQGAGTSFGSAGQVERTMAYTFYDADSPVPGFMHTEIVEPTGDAALKLTTTYTYDTADSGDGSPKIITESVTSNAGGSFTSRVTSFDTSYANGERTLVITNPLGHQTTEIYESKFGQARSVVDANGMATTTQLDWLGRPVTFTDPSGNTTYDYRVTSEFSHSDSEAWYTNIKPDGGAPSRVYYDAFDRVVGTRNKGLNGGYVYTTETYDHLGRTKASSSPFINGADQLSTSYQYDALSRVKSTTYADGTSESTDYSGLTHITTNQSGQQKTINFNAQGWVMKVVDNMGTTIDYNYTPWGDLDTTTVDSNNSTVIDVDYDTLGRRTKLDDPNLGSNTFTYNGFGQLVSETDGNGVVTQYTYDKLDRELSRTDDATGSAVTHTWEYDTAPLGGGTAVAKGYLASTAGKNTDGSDYSEAYTYNSEALLESIDKLVLGEQYKFTYYYDTYQRQVGYEYPSGYGLQYSFNNYGYLNEVSSANTGDRLWFANADDQWGNITDFQLNNNGTATSEIIEVSRAYDPVYGRIISATASIQGQAGTLQDHAYSFSALGNLTSRTDNQRGITQCFGYDNLNRLTHYGIGNAAGCATSSQVTYDKFGNIKTKTGVSGSYTYGAGSAGPNAVTTVDNLDYVYDGAGNFISARSRADDSIVKTATYTAFNKPSSLAANGNTSSFVYDANKSRIYQQDSNRQTIYVQLGEYEIVNTGAIEEHIHYLGGWGTYTINVAANDDYYQYNLRDHIGSVVAKVGEAGDVEYLSNGPWGVRLEEAWNGAEYGPEFEPVGSARGFTDHEHLDDVGLIHMNGRVYDPHIGRFLSPDPIVQAPHNSQNYNRYSYVLNNPLSFTDPTGYQYSCGPNPDGSDGVTCGSATNFSFSHNFAMFIEGISAWLNGDWGQTIDNFRTEGIKPALQALRDYCATTTDPNCIYADVDGIEALIDLGLDVADFENLDEEQKSSVLSRLGEAVVLRKAKTRKRQKQRQTSKEDETPCPRKCFVAGTLVLTEHGYAEIQDVQVGDLVWAKNTETGEYEWKPVVATWVVDAKPIYEVGIKSFGGETTTVEATEDHPFWVVGFGWKTTVELMPGDVLEDDRGEYLLVDYVEDQQRTEIAYNFTVEDFHTFYVTELGVLVHNCPKGSETEGNYTPPPKNIEGIPGLTPAKPKTSVQGGGGLRKRWKDRKGNIYEWDSQHGTVEKYNKRGKHQGEFDPTTGEQTKPADKTRTVEP